MDNPLHDIDELFRNSLEPTEETPSDKVWENINKKLDNESCKKPAATYLWVKIMISILLFIGFTFSFHQFYLHKKLAEKNKNIVLVKHKNLLLPLNYNTLKKENFKEQNKIALKDKIIDKAGVDNGFKKTKSMDTIPTLNNTNKQIILSIKKVPFINTINEHYIANNKERSAHKKISSYLNNSTNKEFVIKSTDDNLADNNLHSLKTVISNGNKINKPKAGTNYFNLNPKLKYDSQMVLNAKKENVEINDITPLQLLIGSNLPNLESPHFPSLQLTHNSISKKAPLNKQPFIAQSRFYISAFAAQEWQGFQLQDNDEQQNNGNQNRGGDTKNKIKHREDEDASLVAGIGIGYRLNKRLSVETGLRYSEFGIKTDSIKLFAVVNNSLGTIGYKINTSLGYGYLNNTNGNTPGVSDSMTIQNLKQSVNYVTMPVLLRINLGKKRLSFNPALGFMFNFILGSSIRTNLDNGQWQMMKLQGLKKISVGMLVTPSVYYRFNNHISLGLEPYFNYTISPINKATVVDSYPYGFGLGTTLRYQF